MLHHYFIFVVRRHAGACKPQAQETCALVLGVCLPRMPVSMCREEHVLLVLATVPAYLVPTLSMHMTCMGPHACLGLAAFPVCLECHSVSWPARPQRCNSLLCTCYGVFCARPLPADGRAFQGRVLAVISCISAHNACAQRLHATSGPLGLYGDHQRRQCQSTEFREWYNEHAKVAFRVKPCVHSPTSYSNMPLKQFSWITIATHACSKHGNVRGVLFLPKKHS